MFWHNFKYSLKTLLRNRIMVFWTFAFPIILGIFFNMAFSNIENSEKLDIIDIAIVDTNEFKSDELYVKTFEYLGDENSEDRLFNIVYVDENKAQSLLENDEVVGYFILNDKARVIVDANGIDETILKYVVEEIGEQISIFERAFEEGMRDAPLNSSDMPLFIESLTGKISEIISDARANIEDASSENLSYTMIEFYTLIAMASLYGGILGMVAINQNLANMSSKGKRVSVSPTGKRTLILSSVSASYVVQLIGIGLLFAFLICFLGIDFGTKLPLIIVLALAGCLAGLTLGIAVATLFKVGEDTKSGIIISFTMLGCFFSGMMGITMKYIIDSHVPLINQLNPANMITDGFYSLYYYSNNTRFCFDLVSLLAFSLVMIGISMYSLKRQKYDSI